MTALKFLPRILRTKTPFLLLMRSAHFPVVVLGGGSAGCSMAARMCRMLGNMNVAVVEPAKVSTVLLGKCFNELRKSDEMRGLRSNLPLFSQRVQ